MKSILKSTILALVLAMGLCPIALSVKAISTATAQQTSTPQTDSISPRSANYLLLPTLVAKSPTETFVYDAETKEIKTIQNGNIVLISNQAQTPLAMQFVAGHLFVLTQSKIIAYKPNLGENPELFTTKITTEQDSNPTETDFSFAGTFSTFYILEEQDGSISLFVQLSGSNNIEIHKYTLTYHESQQVFSATTSSVFNSSTLSSESQNAASQTTAFAAYKTDLGYNFVLTDGTNIYGAAATSQLATCNIISESACQSICALENNFACATNSTIDFFDCQSFQKQQSSIAFVANAICAEQQNLIALQSNEQKVVQLLSTQSTLFQNAQVTPTINSILSFGLTNTPQTLLPQPYSPQSQGKSVSANQQLIILSQGQTGYEEYSYVSFAHGNENYYGFVATEQILPKQTTASNTNATITISCNLYRLPSNISDQTNTVVCTFNKGDKITITNDAANITNNGAKFAYATTQDGKAGYIELAKTTQSSSNSQIKKTQTNATTNKEATIYATASSDQPITTLKKGTRIKIYGLLNPTTKYTRITAEDEFGNTQTGYMLTSAITPDNLTTLQVIGIVLIVSDSILLAGLITFTAIFRKKQAKLVVNAQESK